MNPFKYYMKWRFLTTNNGGFSKILAKKAGEAFKRENK